MSPLIQQLIDIVGEKFVSTEKSDLETYGQDWSRLYVPSPLVVVKHANTAEVALIVKLCASQNIAIVPSGGRTGLSGGAYAINNELA